MLFCRRCHRYDCFLHKDKPVTPDLNKPPAHSSIVYRPCNPRCYQKNAKSSYHQRRTKIELKRSYSELLDSTSCKTSPNGFHSKRTKSSIIKAEEVPPPFELNFSHNGILFKPSLKRKATDETVDWLGSDKTLFRVFYKIYGNNICMIADLLDKPCCQVYAFYRNELETNGKRLFLQRQLANIGPLLDMASSGPVGLKINGSVLDRHGAEDSIEDELNTCNGDGGRPLVGILSS
jgi:hypothetical protein